MPNARLKKLLDKKKNASMMPKSKLAELEDEYIELLSRIDDERKRLGIDDESIAKMKLDIKNNLHFTEWQTYIPTGTFKAILNEEKAINSAARNGDLEDIEYHKNALISALEKAKSEALAGRQLKMF